MPVPGFFHTVAMRLAKRPQGVTNAEMQAATGLPAKDVGSRLAQMTRSKTLRKVVGRPMRWFLP